jgi:hypothetical protein
MLVTFYQTTRHYVPDISNVVRMHLPVSIGVEMFAENTNFDVTFYVIFSSCLGIDKGQM